ncbi:hypothetical protein OMK64_16365 [Cellulomonas fimi]|uniref:hypothetical protein n=1 Tax=Cellulomonas fimi TaxID=1708 RepID=UPI00234D4BA7|nr:hypothetical protein [Cellulomonas fimi]MDC7123107.1 hypothetical protein [Cellulomonas fimi]
MPTTDHGPTREATARPTDNARDRALPLRALDDSDVGWGREPDSNDERLRRDRPPHW